MDVDELFDGFDGGGGTKRAAPEAEEAESQKRARQGEGDPEADDYDTFAEWSDAFGFDDPSEGMDFGCGGFDDPDGMGEGYRVILGPVRLVLRWVQP